MYVVGGAAVVWLAGRARQNPVLFAQFVVDGIRLGFVYALVALGYTMVYGIVRLINFAHGDVFMIGAFAAFYATTRYHWGFIPALVLAMVICAFMAVIIERVAYKPLRDAPRIAALITAIGVSFFLEYFTALNFVFTSELYQSIRRCRSSSELGIWRACTVSNIMFMVIAVGTVCLFALYYLVYRTKTGQGHARGRLGQAHRAADGHRCGPDHLFHLRRWCSPGRHRWHVVCDGLPADPHLSWAMPGLKSFIAAVFGGIGSIPGRLYWGAVHRHGRDAEHGLPELNAARLHRVLDPDHRAALKPTGLFGEAAKEKA